MKSKSTSCGPGTLYITATPIGNLGDWSYRAAQMAEQVEVIACEDTRTSHVLLSHYGISTPTTAYHEHNAEKTRPILIERLLNGDDVMLISDAGTPLISDPGYKLVRDAQAQQIVVVTLPGASSPVAALSIAGLPTDAFYFGGFLPHKTHARQETLKEFEGLRASLVFLESPTRLCASLRDIVAVLGEREVSVCRELTKRYEEVRRGVVSDVLAHYEAQPPKGEIVLVVRGADTMPLCKEDELKALLATLLESHSLKEAVMIACEQTGMARKEVYAKALEVRNEA